MHADAEGLFAVQTAHSIHGPFEVASLVRLAHHLISQSGVGPQGRHEAGVQHPVQGLRLPPQRPRQSRRKGHDPDHQIEQLRLVQEQGLHLHSGAQAREEDREPAEGRIRRPRLRHRRQQLWGQPGEQLAPPRRPRRRNASVVPASDRVGHRGGLGKAHPLQRLQRAGIILDPGEDQAAIGRRQLLAALEQLAIAPVDPDQHRLDPGVEDRQIALPTQHGIGQRRHIRPALGIDRQNMALLVGQHLHPMLQRPQLMIGRRQFVARLGRHMAALGQGVQRLQRARRPQPLVASAQDQLLGLDVELDLADAAAPQL